MTDINTRIERLKKDFLNPNTSDERKLKIIEYFKEYNDLFFSDVDIDAFFKQLQDLDDSE
jgi:hypothetical protein